MKQIIINEKCNGCGMCIVKCPGYFEENADGNTQVINGILADETDEVLKEVIAQCPVDAISFGGSVDKSKLMQEEINKLKELAKGLTVKREDISFTDNYCVVTTFPYIGSSGYNYSSSSAAERAGLSEFKSRAWPYIDDKILDCITTYRVNIIKPYYSTDERSVYTIFNKRVIDVLTALANIVGKGNLPSDFCNVDIYPERDTVWKMLEKGEIIGENFISIVRREFSYSPSDYESNIDWDDMEDYRGRDKYCYRAQDAVEELRRDVQNAVRWARSDIEDSALGYVKGLVDSYNRNLAACLEKKYEQLLQRRA